MSVAELGVDAEVVPLPSAAKKAARAKAARLTASAHAGPALSTREIEVMLAWMACESKEDAANRLFISQSTVSTHISRIRAKYAAVGRAAPTKAHLLARALQDGYTTLDAW